MEKILGTQIILNGKPAYASAYNPEASAGIFYEVIRVLEGKCLFLKDHLERLKSSCEKGGIGSPDKEFIAQQIHFLIEHLKISTGNVKLVVYKQIDTLQTACFFIPHHYPSSADYTKGVRTKTFDFVRPDPTVKKWNEVFRQNVNLFIQQEDIYEAILVNEQNEVTEGSRSNLFFIDYNNRLITASEKIILPGITRKFVMQICAEKNIHVIERPLLLSEIKAMKSCFITGTSPKILPVQSLNEINFEVEGALMKTLIVEYNKMILAQLRE